MSTKNLSPDELAVIYSAAKNYANLTEAHVVVIRREIKKMSDVPDGMVGGNGEDIKDAVKILTTAMDGLTAKVDVIKKFIDIKQADLDATIKKDAAGAGEVSQKIKAHKNLIR